MNHHHRKILHQIFQHPTNANLSYREVESVFGELGGELETRHGNRVAVKLKGHTEVFHHGGHSLPKEEVVQVRKFLGTCGVDPVRDFPL
jgi:hypothetical protein